MNRNITQQLENTFDFDLNNYKLEDLYSLFKLNPEEPLDEITLKKAKRVLLFIHPDKSGLHQKYFQFYSKAYGMLTEIELFSRIKKNK